MTLDLIDIYDFERAPELIKGMDNFLTIKGGGNILRGVTSSICTFRPFVKTAFFPTNYVYMCFLVTFSSTCNFKIEVRFVRLRRKLVRSKFNTLILKHTITRKRFSLIKITPVIIVNNEAFCGPKVANKQEAYYVNKQTSVLTGHIKVYIGW